MLDLAVSNNLAQALQQLRYAKRDRVDAVCINQNDVAEKNQQVLRMTDVYNLAYRVVLWLGPASPSSTDVITTLKYVGAQLEFLMHNLRVVSAHATEPEWYLAHSDLRFSDQTWNNILAFLQRSRFWRVWIVQEVQLANRRAIVMCGAAEIPWSGLRRALCCLWHKHKLPSQEMHDTLAKLVSLTIDQRELPLGSLLIRNVDRDCTDKRDKVYGLLSLAHISFARAIVPNYSLSLTDVYKDVSLAYVNHDMRLEPMRYCEAGTRRIGGCPSWVPDWSSVVDQRFLAGQVSCGVSRAHTKYISPDKLRVTGVLCGTVASMGALAPLKGSDDIANIIREWEPGSLRTEDYAHGGTLFDAFATLICRNNLASRLPD